MTNSEMVISTLRLHPNLNSREIEAVCGLWGSRLGGTLGALTQRGTICRKLIDGVKTYSIAEQVKS